MKLIWIIGMLALVGCNKDFLNTSPTDQLGQGEALATDKNIYAAINGMYRKLVAQYVNQACGGEPSICILRDCLGEDLVHPNTANNFYLSFLRWTDHRNEKAALDEFPFQLYYYQILQANLILESIDDAQLTDTANIHLEGVRGEALCFRAWAHFQLVQLYGGRYKSGEDNIQLGITYRKEVTSKPLPRNSVEDCYAYIHEDLDSAMVCLKDYVPESVTHFSLKVAYGLKARAFLTQQNYTEAAKYAGLAIKLAEAEGNLLMTQEECLGGFSRIVGRTHEALWAANTLDDQSIGFYSFYAYMSWNFNSTAIRLTPRCINSVLYARIAPTDVRAKWWDPTGKMDAPASNYTKVAYQNRKFEVDNIKISAGDFAYMRLAELYLMQAEALARCGQDVEARKILCDFVITRNPNYILSTNSGEALCEEIMIHRRIELWGEGFRFTDLKRLDLSLDRKNTNYQASVASVMEVPAGDVRWQWLIPEREVNVSLGVVIQNE